MPAPGKQIHKLSEKLNVIVQLLSHLKIIESPSLRQLALRAEIEPSTLNKAATQGGLTAEVERKVAECAGFDPANPRWHDPTIKPRDRSLPASEYPGPDTVDAFRAYIFGLYELHGRCRHRAAPLPPKHTDEDIATFALEESGQVVEAGQPLTIFFRLVMKPGYHDNMAYGFRQVRLRLRRAEGEITFGSLLGEGGYFRMKSAQLIVQGGKFNPEWFLSVSAGTLDGEYLTGDPLCELRSTAVGDEIRAELSVHQHDGSLSWRDTKQEILDPAKKAVLTALCNRELANANPAASSGGWLSLGTQTIKIVRGDA